MEKKKKIFYLDFIRVISMIMIVTYHFYAHFAENNITGFKIFSNGKWGMIGVTLFFMISGASLMYNYGEKLDLKKYAKKRFLGIYPMFWIAYTLVFIYIFYGCKGIIWDLPTYKLGISLLAMDGYLSPYTQTFYLIGEWFLGCIVFIYILFPILRKIVNKYPKTFIGVYTIINFALLIFYRNGVMPINKNLIICTYSFVLGMYVIKYIKQFKLWQTIVTLILAIIAYLIPNSSSSLNKTVLIANFMGYNLFIVLGYIGEKIENINIQKIFNIIGKYSYEIFLVHHYIIMKIESTFTNKTLRISETICLYITCWIVIGICAKILYVLNKNIQNLFKIEQKRTTKSRIIRK